MSSRHAEVVRQFEKGQFRWHLADLQSTNGTYVRIPGKVPLKHGQEMLLGGGRFRFDAAPQGQATLGQEMDQHDIGCEVDTDDDQRNPQRGDHILQRVEDPHQERRRRLPGQPEAEECQREGRLPHGLRPELPALEERGGDRHAEQREADRRRHQHKDVQP